MRATIAILFWGALALASLCSCGGMKEASLWPPAAETVKLKGGASPGLLVSITPFDQGRFLLSDYGDIFLLDTGAGTLEKLKFTVLRSGETCNPTGLFYSEKTTKLYVANYHGNNILICRVDGDRKTVTAENEARSDRTVSPENVFVSDDGARLVSANYDGSSVCCFDLSVKPSRELWSSEIPLAHGVCIAGEKVYATSLGKKRLYELDLTSGKILRSSGKRGWDAGTGDLLWPTHVLPLSGKELLVCDAHTGALSRWEKNSLRARSASGHNGATYRFFNMPYSATLSGEQLLVVSTFQKRVVVLDRASFQATKQFILNGGGWESMRERRPAQPLEREWNDYLRVTGPALELLGNRYLMSYGLLHPHEGKKKISTVMMPPGETLFNRGGALYFMDFIEYRKGTVLFSPQAQVAYYISKGAHRYLFPFTTGLDSWQLEGALCTSGGPYAMQSLEERVSRTAESLELARLPGGTLPPAVLFGKLFPSDSPKKALPALEKVFRSSAGRAFWEEYRKVPPGEGKEREVKDKGVRFFDRALKEDSVFLDEIFLVHMLTGLSPGVKQLDL
ncbi:MAG: beta-propeller fold lactonase family protein [Candidatus Eremiobacteraeota bacterium]|nr:beta-propeller fold lactonase family protein [Candidatus Eremiobacteraeota bacterium]